MDALGDETGVSIDVADVLGWAAPGALLLVLIWAANYRGRLHKHLRESQPEVLARAARHLWRAKLALIAALEA
jgi:hypothetical protein